MTKPNGEPVLDQITGTTHHRSIASWTKWFRGDEAEFVYAVSPSLVGEIERLGQKAEELKELRRAVWASYQAGEIELCQRPVGEKPNRSFEYRVQRRKVAKRTSKKRLTKARIAEFAE